MKIVKRIEIYKETLISFLLAKSEENQKEVRNKRLAKLD
jgi:hypothetical protein